jgi:hypothetical protein
MGAETPEGDEIQIGGVEHQLQADEDKDRIAPRQRAGQANAEKQRRQDQVLVQGWGH